MQKNVSRIKAVPESAILLFEADEIDDAFESLQNNSLWNVIEKEDNLKLIVTQLRSLNGYLAKNKVKLGNKKALISVHQVGVKSFDYIIYLDYNDISEDALGKFAAHKVSTKTYDNANIIEYALPVLSSPLFVSDYMGVLIVSRSIILLENSIRQINSKMSLMDNSNFKSLYNSVNSKEDFSLLINFSKLNILKNFSTKKDVIGWTTTFSDWVELDASPEKNEIFLSGIASTNDSIGNFLGIFKNQRAQKITIDELLPSGTAFSIVFGIENFSQYNRSYLEYLRKHGRLKRFELNQKAHKIKRSDLFDTWVGDQFGFASITSNNKGINFNDLVLIKTRDVSKTLKSLQLVSDKSVIDFRSYEIRKVVKKGIFASYLGDGFNKIDSPYYTIVDDVVVFSDDIKIVKNVVSDYLDGRSLVNYQHFKNLKSNLSSKSNILFYFKNPDFAELITDIFPGIKGVISKNIKEISKYKSGAIQFSYDNGNAFTNVLLRQSEEEENEVKPLWEIDFEAELYPEMNTLFNHYTKNKEIAVQDINNVLYLISPSGKILWQKKLGSKILGKIHQVDLYKNRKLQMVFNTQKYMYILDRNGNKVGGFPKKLPWAASAGMSVFDYSKIRDYRFIVPMGKHIRMYDGKGKTVSGFGFKKASAVINKTPQHFRVKGKDFIVISTTSGKVYVLDRRGKSKINIRKKYPLGRNPFYLSESKSLSKSSIVTTTKKGEIFSIYFNSTIDVSAINDFDYYTFYKQVGNQTISLSNNVVKWTNNNSTEIYDVDGGDFCEPQLFENNKERFLIFGAKSINKIFLYDSKMNLQKGFPVYGQIVGEVMDYNRNGVINFPVIVNQGKGNIKMYSIN